MARNCLTDSFDMVICSINGHLKTKLAFYKEMDSYMFKNVEVYIMEAKVEGKDCLGVFICDKITVNNILGMFCGFVTGPSKDTQNKNTIETLRLKISQEYPYYVKGTMKMISDIAGTISIPSEL